MENQYSSSAIEKAPFKNSEVQSIDVSVSTELFDHQLVVDGVIYRELKTLSNNVVIQVFLHITNN